MHLSALYLEFPLNHFSSSGASKRMLEYDILWLAAVASVAKECLVSIMEDHLMARLR